MPAASPVAYPPLPLAGKRLVFLGASITDSHVFPVLVEQALRAAGVGTPTVTNAGVSGDTSAGALARLQRDVLAYRPDVVCINVGVNDANGSVPPAAHTANTAAIVTQLQAAGATVVLLTVTPVFGAGRDEVVARIAAYNAGLAALATRHGCRLGHTWEGLTAAFQQGEAVFGADHTHPVIAGYRVMARAVLDALGYPQVPVPATLAVTPWPGLLTDWQVRALPDDHALTAAEVAALAPDATWTPLHLPLPGPLPEWNEDMDRVRGVAFGLDRRLGMAPRYVAHTTLVSPTARTVCLNTGALVHTVWLNGLPVLPPTPIWYGWHAGRDRLMVSLRAGPNTLVLESGPAFLLFVTADATW